MKKPEHTEQEIHWYTNSIYIDIETGEIINKQQYEEDYYKIGSRTETKVYRSTGTKTIYIECKRRESKQGKLF